jgi:hypothetical protein
MLVWRPWPGVPVNGLWLVLAFVVSWAVGGALVAYVAHRWDQR